MRRILVSMIGIAALAGCGPPRQTTVTSAWVRLAAAPGRPAAGYFTVRGGATDQTLIAVSTPAAARVELHETMTMGPGPSMGSGGAMTMKPVARVRIPAGGTISFAPGGKHLMLFDVAPAIGKGANLPMTFTFADGHVLRVPARAIAAGDPPPVS